MLRSIAILFLYTHYCSSGGLGSRRVREMNCDCGIKNDGNTHLGPDKINFAGNHVWPWMGAVVNISISDDPVAYCGASLISNRYLITAGHCIPDMQTTGMENFRVYLGTNFIVETDQDESAFLDLEILEIKSHPKFDFDSGDFDIALIKLRTVVNFSKFIRPVCLKQPQDLTYVGKVGVITGWGSWNLTTPTEDELKESNMEVVPNPVCSQNYSTFDIPVTDTMLCASLDGQDPCKGDSGGPLVLRDSRNRFNQIGIISHGAGCNTVYPTIFSRVSSFIDWIVESTKEDSTYCRGTF